MVSLFKVNEWQAASGRWYVANTNGSSRSWWLIPRLLGVTLSDYVLLLKDKYNASGLKFIDYGKEDKRNSLLIFSFQEYSDAHRFLLDVNRTAREKKFFM